MWLSLQIDGPAVLLARCKSTALSLS